MTALSPQGCSVREVSSDKYVAIVSSINLSISIADAQLYFYTGGQEIQGSGGGYTISFNQR